MSALPPYSSTLQVTWYYTFRVICGLIFFFLIAPILIGLGFDPVWLGILITILLETALITPPVGVNLYIVHGVRDGGAMNDVIIGTLPFVLTMFVMIGMLVMFPKIALFLPSLFY